MRIVKCLQVVMLVVAGSWLSACGGGGGGGAAAGPTPAPQAGVIALPKTGQTTCSDASGVAIACAGTGQDGALQTGVVEPSPRFVIGGSGSCVTDNLTGLLWAQNANLPAGARTWQQALDYANTLTLCGFTDWRLPNREELRSLVNYGQANSASSLNALGFSNVQANFYWSSSSYASANNAWIVSMSDGFVLADNKSSSGYVWPVRAGQ